VRHEIPAKVVKKSRKNGFFIEHLNPQPILNYLETYIMYNGPIMSPPYNYHVINFFGSIARADLCPAAVRTSNLLLHSGIKSKD